MIRSYMKIRKLGCNTVLDSHLQVKKKKKRGRDNVSDTPLFSRFSYFSCASGIINMNEFSYRGRTSRAC